MRFFFKGLPADGRFEAHTVAESADLAAGTLYEAWFRALQLSPYIAEGVDHGLWRSDRVREIHREFGDLRGQNFREWWIQQGHQLFAEERGYVPLRVAEEWPIDVVEAELVREDILRLEVPLTLSPVMLREQFDAILREHHKHYADYDRWKTSTARKKLQTRRFKDRDVMRCLDVYQRWSARSGTGRERLYKIGQAAGIAPAYHPVTRDRPNIRKDDSGAILVKQEKLSKETWRHLAKAKLIIANASEGNFPCADPHRWVAEPQSD